MRLRFRPLIVTHVMKGGWRRAQTERMGGSLRAARGGGRGRVGGGRRALGGHSDPPLASYTLAALPAAVPEGYELGEGRRWRTLDVGTMPAYLAAGAERVRCERHGAVVAAVAWARHDFLVTRQFEDEVAWLTVQGSKTASLD
jgi:hypothetical protein